jgi:hypothetical protein
MNSPYDPRLDYFEGRQNYVPDLRFSENQQNRGFAMPGGFNSNNAIVNMLGSILVSSQLGIPMEEIGPLQGYGGTDMAYLNASQRQSEYRATRNSLINNAPGLRNFDKNTSSNSLFQELYNMSGAGGGNMDKAYQAAVNRFSGNTRLGYGIRDQSRVAENMVRGISDAYTERDDDRNISNDYKGNPLFYSRQKSFGFDVTESIRNLDVMRKLGTTGFSDKEIREATEPDENGKLANPEKLEQLSKQANKFMHIAKQTFGEDLDMSQLADLVDKATDGMSKISGAKASEFASKIQSTAAALDINAKNFAEYMEMQQRAMKSIGVTGGSSTTAIMNAAISAKSLQQAAQSTGDKNFSDLNKAMDVSQRITRSYAASEDGLAFRAAARIIGGKTQKQRVTEKIGDMNLNEFIEAEKEAHRTGNIKEIERLNKMAYQTFGQHEMARAKGMDDQVGALAEARAGVDYGEIASMGVGARGTYNEFMKKVDQQDRDTRGENKGKMNMLLDQKGITQEQVLKGLTIDQMQDFRKVAEKLQSMGVDDPYNELAQATAHASVDATSMMKAEHGKEYFEQHKAEITKISLDQFPKDAEEAKRVEAESIEAEILASVMGGMSGNKLSPGQLVDAAGKAEASAKAAAKARGSDTVTMEDAEKALKEQVGALADSPTLGNIKKAITSGKDGKSELRKMAERVQMARQESKAAGDDPDETDAKADAVLQEESKKLGLEVNKEELDKVKAAKKQREGKPSDVPSGSGSASAAPAVDTKELVAAMQEMISKSVGKTLEDILDKMPQKIITAQASSSKTYLA